jgi:hypothetical protein
MDLPDQDTIELDIVAGGRVRCSAPRTTSEWAQIFTTVVSVSLLLRCDLVLARHWLPGMHLFVEAGHHLHRPGRTLIEGVGMEWQRLEPDVVAWLDQADDSDHLVVSLPTTFGGCHLARDRADLCFDQVAFSFDLQWRLPAPHRA